MLSWIKRKGTEPNNHDVPNAGPAMLGAAGNSSTHETSIGMYLFDGADRLESAPAMARDNGLTVASTMDSFAREKRRYRNLA